LHGGSTLTQQLVKNFFLNAEYSLARKFNEALMSLILEAHYSKDEILEAYLNEIYLGQDGARAVHGFGLASQFYFSRSLDELQLHHIALLVAMVKGPQVYNPIHGAERTLQRRNLVLDLMRERGDITQEQADAAKTMPLDVVQDAHQAISRYPAFLDQVRRQLQRDYRNEDLTSEGLRIFTTLDVEAQQNLEASAETVTRKVMKQYKLEELETAAVLTRRTTGEIAALIGSRDPKNSGFDRAMEAVRPIGSLYKPVVYLTALADPARYSVITPLEDSAIRVESPGSPAWSPKNYDHQEHGIIPLHQALAHSFNLATVRLGMDLGVDKTIETLRGLGVDRQPEAYPSVLLGTVELSPMEVAQMYQTLANDGFVTPLKAIHAVLSKEGQALQKFPLEVRQGAEELPVYLLDTILQEVFTEGTARSALAILPQGMQPAGKTGTTNDLKDSWFAGFTGDYVGVVWMGRDDNQPVKLTGAQGALQLWASVMAKTSHEALQLLPPEGAQMEWIDRENGLLASEACPSAARYPFITGYVPKEYSTCSPGTEGNEQNSWLKKLF
jgi:penicillin-binding protein 1B